MEHLKFLGYLPILHSRLATLHIQLVQKVSCLSLSGICHDGFWFRFWPPDLHPPCRDQLIRFWNAFLALTTELPHQVDLLILHNSNQYFFLIYDHILAWFYIYFLYDFDTHNCCYHEDYRRSIVAVWIPEPLPFDEGSSMLSITSKH